MEKETIQVRFLADFLNEMLATERSGASLYRMAIARCSDQGTRRQLEAMRDQAVDHEQILLDLIKEMEGQPGPASIGVQTVLAAMTAAMAQPVEPEYQQWKDLETLLAAELMDQRNWDILRAVFMANHCPHLQRAVDRVGNQEDEHVQYLRQAVMERAPYVVLSG